MCVVSLLFIYSMSRKGREEQYLCTLESIKRLTTNYAILQQFTVGISSKHFM